MNRNEKLKALAKKAYECANISNDDCTTYPIGDDWVVQVSTIENGKTFNFISPANAKKRMEKQLLDNKRNNYLPENGAESNNTKDEMFTHDGTSFYDNLVNVKIPEGFTTIGSNAFYGCKSLTSIELPEGLTTISSYAFQNCKNLTSIDLPESLTIINTSAFQSCTSLKTINFKGTDEQWNAISKGSNWYKNCPSDMQIICNYQGE